MQQVSLQVFPTRTVYEFEQDGVSLEVVFFTPALPNDLETFSRPLTYLTLSASSSDGKEHSVKLYYDNTAETVINDSSEPVLWSRTAVDASGLTVMRIGTAAQDYLGQTGDRLNWGQWYVSIPDTLQDGAKLTTAMASALETRASFVAGLPLPSDNMSMPRNADDNWPVLAASWDLGTVRPPPAVAASVHLTVALDQVFSIQYFGAKQVPYWRRGGGGGVSPASTAVVASMLLLAEQERASAMAAGAQLDADTVAALTEAGGDEYATMGALAFRQAMGATEVVWNHVLQTPWMFLKEISSDGDVSTVDVLFPSSPLYLYTNPEILRLLLMPVLAYANNETKPYGQPVPYNLSWAPHHLGEWPICNELPMDQEQMPMEESGNMILMIAAIAQRQQAQLAYLQPYWPLLIGWADFLVSTLPDPGNQLCTDDFEGPSPHNVNLAAKGIVALSAMAQLCRSSGRHALAAQYSANATAFVKDWITMSNSSGTATALTDAMQAATLHRSGGSVAARMAPGVLPSRRSRQRRRALSASLSLCGDDTAKEATAATAAPSIAPGSSAAAAAAAVCGGATAAALPPHSRLQYNLPHTWSLKYNLLFQRVLSLPSASAFPPAVFQGELTLYQQPSLLHRYGVPLDCRHSFGKADWLMWVGAMGSRAQFDALVTRLYSFLQQTPSRYPFADWYCTQTGHAMYFRARPVVGGVYARMLLQS